MSKPELQPLREEIREITKEILRLMAKRIDIAKEISIIKKKAGLTIEDRETEKRLKDEVLGECQRLGINQTMVMRVLNMLIEESIQVQKRATPAYGAHMDIFQTALKMESEGKKIIHFEVGEPDFPPPSPVLDAVTKSLHAGKFRYSLSTGIESLRGALANHLNDKHGTTFSSSNVIITPGGRFGLYMVLATMIRPGDEVIVIDPAWPAYRGVVNYLGARALAVRTTLEDGWTPDPEKLEALTSDSTRMMIINYPNNPTGKVLKRNELRTLLEIAKDRKISVLSDEVYSDFSFVPFTSALDIPGAETFYLSSFSKAYAMTGFRIGFVVAEQKYITKMTELSSLLLTNVPEFIQYAAVEALNDPTSAKKNCTIMRHRVEETIDFLNKRSIKFYPTEGGFYVFPEVRSHKGDGDMLSKELLAKGIAIAPGSGFGEYRNFVRLSLALPDKELKEGLDDIGKGL